MLWFNQITNLTKETNPVQKQKTTNTLETAYFAGAGILCVEAGCKQPRPKVRGFSCVQATLD